MLWKNQFGKAAVGVVCVLLFSVAVVAQDSEFTYQGELTQDGNLANGSFNITFSLWNAVVGGCDHPLRAMGQALVVGAEAKLRLQPGSTNWTGTISHKVLIDAPFGTAAIGN